MAIAVERATARAESFTVCLVDDDPMMCALFSRVIQRTGCTVFLCRDAAEAILVLAQHRIDLVLSDLMMPNSSDGEKLLKSILRMYPAVPVFMMSGNMCPDTQARLVGYGASACLMKPFTADVFRRLIADLDR